MKVTVLLFLIPTLFCVVNGENCIELEECEQLSWLNSTKNNDTFDDIKTKFDCSEPAENTVNCPEVTTEQLTEEDVQNNFVDETRSNSTDHW